MKIAIVGLGLIGGSLAKTIKAKTNYYISAYDHSAEVIETAINDKTIDSYTQKFSKYDMTIIALYPNDTIRFLVKHVGQFSPDSLVIDCCGVKESICSKANVLFKENSKAVFIGGHPMAGREFSGYENSLPTLFDHASMILTPDEKTPSWAVKKAEKFFSELNFKSITTTTPRHHDQIIAYTSQLAHVVSNAYMQSPTAKEFKGFSAGSFADLTRVAKLNPTMWSELFFNNKTALSAEIDILIKNLELYKNYIENNQEELLYNILKQGSDIKEKLTAER